ncbi:MAG TPA: tetratricopeptide repeat protein [Terriglobales bacterium]|nr:tetratricopeptide repeat protein [Terriglobales bacterium]
MPRYKVKCEHDYSSTPTHRSESGFPQLKLRVGAQNLFDPSRHQQSAAFQSPEPSRGAGSSLSTPEHTYGEVYFHRGIAYAELRQYQRAIQDYNEAIRLKASDVLAHDSRGVAYVGPGQYERAIEDYKEALLIDSRYAWAYGHRGLAWLYLQRDVQAESDFKKAFEIDPFVKSTFEPLINEAKTKRQLSPPRKPCKNSH